jgi:hypothetical protein
VKPTKMTNVDFRLQAPIHRHLALDRGYPLCLIFVREEMGGPNNMGQPCVIANCHKKEKKP